MLQRQFSIKSSTDQPTNLPGMHKAVQARHCKNSQCIVKSQCELRMQRNRNSRQHSLRRLHKRLPSLGGHGEIHCQERGTLCQTLPAPHAKMCSTAQGRCLSLLTSQTSYCSICTGSGSTSQHFSNVIQKPVHVFEDQEFSHYITLRSRTRCRPESRSKFICGEAAGTLNYIRILHAPSFFSPGSQGLMCDSNSAGGEKHQTCQLMRYTSLNKDSDLNITDGQRGLQ